jgi:uncharacterized cupin superfamily protein
VCDDLPVERVPEAKLEATERGLVPTGQGWYILNTADAPWVENDDFGRFTYWEGDASRFEQVGMNISVLRPGQPMCMYHAESAQEDFLVLAGEGTLVIEGEERPLRAWDLVHCPAWTRHVLVAGGEEPMVVLAVGARMPGKQVVYPRDEAALRHGAGVETETPTPSEAYAGSAEDTPVRYRPGDLPGL